MCRRRARAGPFGRVGRSALGGRGIDDRTPRNVARVEGLGTRSGLVASVPDAG